MTPANLVLATMLVVGLLFNAIVQQAARRDTAAPAAVAAVPAAHERELIVPVAGVPVGALVDTWGAARADGRSHQGIDIIAPMGRPALAAADGRIAKFFDSERGGVTVYQYDETGRLVYYYAHLQARAPGLREGQAIRRGEPIGFVGMSGNAPVPHLHFEIQRLAPGQRWWEAEAVNPYPHLRSGRAPGA